MPESDEIEIVERIDSGLYGSVYRAIQKPLGRQVAVKIIKTELMSADALAHAAPLARVNHPTIVTVHTLQEIYIPELNQRVPALCPSVHKRKTDVESVATGAIWSAGYRRGVCNRIADYCSSKRRRLVQPDDDGTSSLRYARYLPQWG